MEINPRHLAPELVKADVIKPLEAGPVDGAHAVVRHEEVLLPPHEDVLALLRLRDDGVKALARLLAVWAEGGELGPVREVDLFVGAPPGVLGYEAVLGANDLAFEVGCQGGVIVG